MLDDTLSTLSSITITCQLSGLGEGSGRSLILRRIKQNIILFQLFIPDLLRKRFGGNVEYLKTLSGS